MTRATTLVRLGTGAALTVVPGPLARASGAPDTTLDRRVARVLGLRYLAQGGLALAADTPAGVDAAVDLVHAASMVPVALVSRRRRRAALTSAAVALALGAVDLVGGRRR